MTAKWRVVELILASHHPNRSISPVCSREPSSPPPRPQLASTRLSLWRACASVTRTSLRWWTRGHMNMYVEKVGGDVVFRQAMSCDHGNSEARVVSITPVMSCRFSWQARQRRGETHQQLFRDRFFRVCRNKLALWKVHPNYLCSFSLFQLARIVTIAKISSDEKRHKSADENIGGFIYLALSLILTLTGEASSACP